MKHTVRSHEAQPTPFPAAIKDALRTTNLAIKQCGFVHVFQFLDNIMSDLITGQARVLQPYQVPFVV